MCGTCGCSDGAASIHGEDGTHTHVLADGTVITHAHGDHDHPHPPHGSGHHHHPHGSGHDHPHPHGSGHAHGPAGHVHAHGPAGHVHAHAHAPAHAPAASSGTIPTVEGRVDPGTESLEAQILGRNDKEAARNRGWFEGRGIFAINVMSSPGSGKTTLLERALRELDGPAFVLEGDQETSFDAERIRKTGAQALQINTGQGCHLEAHMVGEAVRQMSPPPGGLVVIENVGNLVCPALFDLGESARVVLFSVTEGKDKPEKYPHMFRVADLVLLTKSDLLPHLDFDVERARSAVRAVNPDATLLEVSSKTGHGMSDFYGWLDARRAAR